VGKYIEMFGVFQVEGIMGLANDLLAEFNGHVVGVVGILNDPTNDEFGCDFGKH